MKIVRFIEGKRVVLKLTPQELQELEREFQHRHDASEVNMYLRDNGYKLSCVTNKIVDQIIERYYKHLGWTTDWSEAMRWAVEDLNLPKKKGW